MKILQLLLLIFLLLPLDVFAQPNAQMLYTRTNIMIHRKAAAQTTDAPMPWSEGNDNTVVLDVEIRDGMGLYNQRGWYNLSSYSEKSGVLMAFTEPSQFPIIHSSQYAPVDILFIDARGKITQIAPNISLSNLEADIYPGVPILAFLFVKGGTCATLSINPGDEVEYAPLFKKPPVVLSTPEAASAAASNPAPMMNIPTVTDITPPRAAPIKPVSEKTLGAPKKKIQRPLDSPMIQTP